MGACASKPPKEIKAEPAFPRDVDPDTSGSRSSRASGATNDGNKPERRLSKKELKRQRKAELAALPPEYHQPPPPLKFGGAVVMPPPPISPRPGEHPEPTNPRIYFHAYLIHLAHAVLKRDYDDQEAHIGHAPKVDETWQRAIARVRCDFTVYVNGTEHHVRFDHEGPPPSDVKAYLRSEPVCVFDDDALGMYHPEVRSKHDKKEDAALLAAFDHVVTECMREHKEQLDPYRDIVRVCVIFDLITAVGARIEHVHRHEGGPDDRVCAYQIAARRVRGW